MPAFAPPRHWSEEEFYSARELAPAGERWQPDDERPAILADQLFWHPDGAAAAFELDIPSMFRDAAPL